MGPFSSKLNDCHLVLRYNNKISAQALRTQNSTGNPNTDDFSIQKTLTVSTEFKW